MTTNKTNSYPTLKVGHLIALDMAPLFVGIESGSFHKHGLHVEAVPFTEPYVNGNALCNGQTDIAINSFTLPYIDQEKGAEVQLIAAAGGWGIIEVIAQGDLNIQNMAELKRFVRQTDRKLRVGTIKGDSLDLILKRAFVKAGLSLDEVEMVHIDDVLSMVDVFKEKKVDILSHIKPYTTDLAENHGAIVLTKSHETWVTRTPNTGICVMKETMEKRPEDIAAYLNGLQDAAKIINDTPEKAVELLSGKEYFHVDDAILLKAFKSAPEEISFEPDTHVISGITRDMIDMGYIQDATKAEQVTQIAVKDWHIENPIHWQERKKKHVEKAPFWQPALFGLLSLVLFFSAWEYAGKNPDWTMGTILPPPSQFIQSVAESDFSIGLGAQAVPVTQAIASTFYRVFSGIGIAFVLALITGSLFSLSRIVSWMVSPLLHLFAPIAPIAWIPLAILLFGIGNTTAIFVVFMGVYFILTIATLAEIKRIPPALKQTAQNLGASPVQQWVHVVLPAILPGVFTSLRINFIAAWMAVLAAEMVGLRDGIGSIIMMGRNLFNSDLILFGMVLIAISGFLVDAFLTFIGKRLLWWKLS